MRRVTQYLPILAIALLVWMVFLILSQQTNVITQPSFSVQTPQTAAIPEGFTREGVQNLSFDSRFLRVSPMMIFRTPTAAVFSAPLGTKNGSFTYNAQPYWKHNPLRGGYHTGDDLNGIGGQNSDLGDPVYAIGDGLVTYCGTPSAGWGKVIILSHRISDGSMIQSIYAHLQTQLVRYGQLIPRGETIGTVGTAQGRYLAHLHFELRIGRELHIGPGYLQDKRQHISPTKFFQTRLNSDRLFHPSAFTSHKSDWSNLEIKNPAALSEILSKEE